ncbi:MAG: ROK family glucokinase, partial [Gaiellaceae bacterium]
VELGTLLFGPLQDAFRRHVEGSQYRPPIAIVPAELGERAAEPLIGRKESLAQARALDALLRAAESREPIEL